MREGGPRSGPSGPWGRLPCRWGGSHNRLAGYVPGNEGARRVVNVARDGGVHVIILDTVVAARVDAALSDQLITMAAGHGRAAGGAPRGLRNPTRGTGVPGGAVCQILRKSAAGESLFLGPAINGEPGAALYDLGILDRERAAAWSPSDCGPGRPAQVRPSVAAGHRGLGRVGPLHGA